MSDIFFRQLEVPEPHLYLGVGSGSHAQQTAGNGTTPPLWDGKAADRIVQVLEEVMAVAISRP